MRRSFPLKKIPPRRPASPTSWESVSKWYGEHLSQGTSLIENIVYPGALKLLDPRTGGNYLDIACGEGSFAARIAKVPGVKVTGFDASPALVKKAESRSLSSCRFLVADAARFADRFPPASFDGAACLLAMQNIESYEAVLRDAGAVLKPDAAFIVVMNHPCFRQPRQSGWGWDEGRHLQYRRVDRYLSSYDAPIQMRPGAAPSLKTLSYHRPLSAYAAALKNSGFLISDLEEWVSPKTSDSGPKARAENIARAEIPLFLAIRAVKK